MRMHINMNVLLQGSCIVWEKMGTILSLASKQTGQKWLYYILNLIIINIDSPVNSAKPNLCDVTKDMSTTQTQVLVFLA